MALKPDSSTGGEGWPQKARQMGILAVTLGPPSHCSEHRNHQLFDMSNELDKVVRRKRGSTQGAHDTRRLTVNAVSQS